MRQGAFLLCFGAIACLFVRAFEVGKRGGVLMHPRASMRGVGYARLWMSATHRRDACKAFALGVYVAVPAAVRAAIPGTL
jgi:hypothetical protein